MTQRTPVLRNVLPALTKRLSDATEWRLALVRRRVGMIRHGEALRTIHTLDAYAPYTLGHYDGLEREILDLTLQSAAELFPRLVELGTMTGASIPQYMGPEAFCSLFQAHATAERVGQVFDDYGCEKGPLGYHFVYGAVLHVSPPSTLLEIGLGSPDPGIVSNMGVGFRPGNSLRAFRQILPEAHLYGADIDRSILFTEERIQTFHVDQTSTESVDALAEALPPSLDLIIDDGLHSPVANLAILRLAMSKLSANGWVVIEDIAPSALNIWRVIATMLSSGLESYLIETPKALMYVARRRQGASA